MILQVIVLVAFLIGIGIAYEGGFKPPALIKAIITVIVIVAVAFIGIKLFSLIGAAA